LFAYGIFEVIYAPRKAFKEITQNPGYLGPILIMILFIAANTGFSYILASKSYYEQTLPSGVAPKYDEWTQSKGRWTSNASISESNDSLSGGYYGNKSIEFDMTNGKEIYMQINFNQSVDCYGSDGYKNMSFRVKMIYPNTTTLESASMYLFSNETDYFKYNFTGYYSFPSNSTLWNNLTIPVGPASGWTNSSANADWSHIISLKYDFVWSENANLTIRLTGLFFRGVFKSGIEEASISSNLLNSSSTAVMEFVITWILLGGLIFLICKGLGAKGPWKPMLILVGFVLITLFVEMMIYILLGANLPNLKYPLEYLGGSYSPGYQSALNKIAQNTALAFQIESFVDIGVTFWIIGLCTLAIRQLNEFSWSKSLLVAVVAYFIIAIVENIISTL
jgi:hypothetical protein